MRGVMQARKGLAVEEEARLVVDERIRPSRQPSSPARSRQRSRASSVANLRCGRGRGCRQRRNGAVVGWTGSWKDGSPHARAGRLEEVGWSPMVAYERDDGLALPQRTSASRSTPRARWAPTRECFFGERNRPRLRSGRVVFGLPLSRTSAVKSSAICPRARTRRTRRDDEPRRRPSPCASRRRPRDATPRPGHSAASIRPTAGPTPHARSASSPPETRSCQIECARFMTTGPPLARVRWHHRAMLPVFALFHLLDKLGRTFLARPVTTSPDSCGDKGPPCASRSRR